MTNPFENNNFAAQYADNQKQQLTFEGSPENAKEIQTESFRDEMAPTVNEETKKVANDDDSGVVGSMINLGKHAVIGAAKGVEEIGQTFRLLEDNAWNLPTPQTTAESLAQGFGQFLPAFIPIAGAVGKVGQAARLTARLRMTGLASSSKKAKRAADFLIGTSAGVVTDIVAFDPKDPNAANFLLTTGAISRDSAAGAAVKALLAQDDADSEALARIKSATTGVIAGAIVTGMFRAAGYATNKVRPGQLPEDLDGIPTKKLQEEAQVEAETYTDGVLKTRGIDPDTLDPSKVRAEGDDPSGPLYNVSQEMNKQFSDDLPGLKGAAEDQSKKAANDYVRPWDRLTSEKQTEAAEIISKWAETGEVDAKDLSIIESMNFLKLDSPEEIKEALQFLSEKMDIKRLLKGRVATKDFDIESGAKELLDIPENEFARILEEQSGNVRGAIKFVGVARAMGAAAMKKAEDAFELFANGGKEGLYDEGLSNTKLAYDMLAAGGELSKASSDLLRAHQKLVNQATSLRELRTAVNHSVIKNDPKLNIKQAGWFSTKKNSDKLKIEAQFPGGIKKKSTVSRKTATKTVTERVQSTIKTLTKQLEDIKKGVVKKKAEKLPQNDEIDSLRAEIKELKDADKLPKEQIAARKEFEKLSKKIRDLEEGKTKLPKEKKKNATVEISKLKAELKRLQAKLKKPKSDVDKSAAKIDLLNKKLNKLLLAKKGDIQPKGKETKRVKSDRELELEEAIKKQEERLGLIEKKGLSDDELRAFVTDQARKSEIKDIAKATRQQLTSRAKAMNKSFAARGRDAMLEIYINGLLSSIKTFEINLMGNSTAIITSVVERTYAGLRRKGTGSVTTQEAGELAKSYWNSISSLPDMWKLWKEAYRLEPTRNIKQDFIRPHDRALSAEALRAGGNLGHMINMFGSVVNFPGRILLTADEVFKSINYRAEVRALSYRKAFREVGLEGGNVGDKVKIKNRFNEIMKDLDAHEDITEEATGFSAKNTFTNPLQSHVVKGSLGEKDKVVKGLGLRVKGILDADQTGIARVFVPFFQTPANLLNFAWERTPGLRRWNKGLQAELADDAPTAVRELAQAKVATANMMWVSTVSLAMSGEITGGPPLDHRLRKNLEADMKGSHWYSYRSPIDGKWHKYDRFDPIGVIMGASANVAVMGKAAMNLAGQYEKGDPSDEIHAKYQEVLQAGTVGMVRLITDRHYLQSFSEMISLFSGDGSLLSKFQKSGEKVLGVFNPVQAMSQGFYSSLRRNITGGLEPEKLSKMQRTELNDFNDVVKELGIVFEEGMRKVTPGYGEKRAVKNLAGETTLFPGTNDEVDRQPYRVLRNLATAVFDTNPGLTQSKSPLINALARLESTVSQPSSVNRIGGVLINDEEKGFFIDTWTNMNKSLNRFAASNNFLRLPEGLQRLTLETVIRANKQKATKITMAKYRRILEGALEIKRNNLERQAQQKVPTGFNFANIRGQ